MKNPPPTTDALLLAHFSQMYRSFMDAVVDRIDVHRGQATLLCALVKQDGMTQTEIAEQLAVQGATITNMLQRMEESGLVVRQRDPDDNRLVRVYVTEKGRHKEEAINRQLQNLEETLFASMSQEDRGALRQMVQKLIAIMESKG